LRVPAFACAPKADAVLWGWLAGGVDLHLFSSHGPSASTTISIRCCRSAALVGGNLIARALERFGTTAKRGASARVAGLAVLWLIALLHRPARDRAVLHVEQETCTCARSRRQSARPGTALDRDRPLRSLADVLHSPQGWDGRSLSLDAVRRAERDSQRCALLHRSRTEGGSRAIPKLAHLGSNAFSTGSTPRRNGPYTSTDPAKVLPGAEARWQEIPAPRTPASPAAMTRAHYGDASRSSCSVVGASNGFGKGAESAGRIGQRRLFVIGPLAAKR